MLAKIFQILFLILKVNYYGGENVKKCYSFLIKKLQNMKKISRREMLRKWKS